MKALLDGNPIDLDRPTLAACISAGAKRAESLGRIIIEVKADGASVLGDQLANPSDVPGVHTEVLMISADPRTLVRVSLHDAIEALTTLKPLHSAVADALTAGNIQAAMDQLREVLGTWQAVQELIEHSRVILRVDLSKVAMTDGNAGFDEQAQKFVVVSKSIQQAVQNQDWSALSDIVAYDLDAAADGWSMLLNALSEHVQKMKP